MMFIPFIMAARDLGRNSCIFVLIRGFSLCLSLSLCVFVLRITVHEEG